MKPVRGSQIMSSACDNGHKAMKTDTDREIFHVLPPVATADAAGAEAETTRIRPAAGWQVINVGELWRYRELLFFLIWRDVKVRYKQTVLGAAWAILQPLMMMVVFTIFFGRLARLSSGDFPYPLFAFAGLLPWTFFATAVATAGNSVVGSERLITKVYFPRLAIPFASVGAAVVDFGIAFGMLLVLMLWYGVLPGPGIVLAPLIFAVILLAAVGVGTLMAGLTVAYRDFRYVVPFLVQVWMFATPTVYMQPDSNTEGLLQSFLVFNPMTTLIANFRAACLGGTIEWGPLGIATLCVLIVVLVGCFYFRRVEDDFADII
jgi:lipopolysaccharide transport system permease protein